MEFFDMSHSYQSATEEKMQQMLQTYNQQGLL